MPTVQHAPVLTDLYPEERAAVEERLNQIMSAARSRAVDELETVPRLNLYEIARLDEEERDANE